MRVTVLGCSGSVPGPDAPASGYLLEADGYRLAVDFGNGTFAALCARMDPFALDGVLLSHLHPDHCADLTALSVLRRYHPEPPSGAPLPLYAPAEAPTRLAGAAAPDEAERLSTDLTDVFDFRRIEPGTERIGPFDVRVIGVDHLCESYGFRIGHAGKVLAYTGDTGPCESLHELADGADLLLAEASWTHHADRPTGVHLSGTQAGEVAARAATRRLLVTHVPPWVSADAVLNEASTVYSGPISLAEQRATYEL